MFVLSLYAFFRRLRLLLCHDLACHKAYLVKLIRGLRRQKITRPPLNLMHASAALPVTGTAYSLSVAYRQSQALLARSPPLELCQDSNH
jgi:hypothetical protein